MVSSLEFKEEILQQSTRRFSTCNDKDDRFDEAADLVCVLNRVYVSGYSLLRVRMVLQ